MSTVCETTAEEAVEKGFLSQMSAPLAEQIRTLRDIAVLMGSCLMRLAFRKWRRKDIMTQIVQIGIGSIPIIVVATAFAGLVVTNEIVWHMDQALHTVSMIPGFTGQFILRELGIAIPSLLLVAKVGAAITAEVGTMKVTEQIDALKLLRIDPVDYLVMPRLVASIFSGVCLTLIASAVTLFCAITMAVMKYGFSYGEYLNTLRHFVRLGDMACAITKGMVYGAVIPIIACGYGFRCQGGAEGVGNATTNAVVTSTVTIIILDFILTYAFSLIL